jgi:ABC-type oligopeptide transport system substrate-binding subunit
LGAGQGWVADFPDPENFLSSTSWKSQTGWRNSKYTLILEKARSLTDQMERMAMYKKAEMVIMKEIPVSPLAYYASHVFVKPWLIKIPILPMAGIYHLKDVVLDPDV